MTGGQRAQLALMGQWHHTCKSTTNVMYVIIMHATMSFSLQLVTWPLHFAQVETSTSNPHGSEMHSTCQHMCLPIEILQCTEHAAPCKCYFHSAKDFQVHLSNTVRFTNPTKII